MTYTDDFVAGPGGVMTEEVGVITGELTLRTSDGPEVAVDVAYKGAEEWYPLARATLHDPRDAEALHRVLLSILHRPKG